MIVISKGFPFFWQEHTFVGIFSIYKTYFTTRVVSRFIFGRSTNRLIPDLLTLSETDLYTCYLGHIKRIEMYSLTEYKIPNNILNRS